MIKEERLYSSRCVTLKSMNGARYVYVAEADDGSVKVGISVQPEGRIKSISTASGKRIINQWHSPGFSRNASYMESAIKEHFKEVNIFGEWFRCGFDEMKEYAEKIYYEYRTVKVWRKGQCYEIS